MSNFYEILRVRSNASQAQIKKAYLELVSKYHPDIYKGDKSYAERYTAIITEAYSILKDPDRRQDYDIRHNISNKPSFFQILREDKQINKEKQQERRLSNKNLEQEISMKYFKNSERKKPVKKNFVLKVLTSKLFYSLLFVFGIEVLVILFIYNR